MADFLSGGYAIAQRPSASPEETSFFPDEWTIEWVSCDLAERERKAAEFGIWPDRLPEAIRWATAAFESAFGWPRVFYTLEAAREARRQWIPSETAVILIGTSLQVSDAPGWLECAKPPDPIPGHSPVGETGIYQCIKARIAPAEGGAIAGYEVLRTTYGLIGESAGLFHSEDEARSRCAPGWLPWRITVYPAG